MANYLLKRRDDVVVIEKEGFAKEEKAKQQNEAIVSLQL